MSRLIKLFILSVVLIGICYSLFVVIRRPSNDRNWNTDQAILPTITIDGNTVGIKNIRNFTYRSTTDYTPGYYDAIYNISDITRVWFAVEPFLQTKIGAAHTLVSFEFRDGRYLAISVEIRKEQGESFSPVKGILRNYELMYVIADERDVLGLRTLHRKDDVYLYPIKTTPERAQQLFVSMLNRAQQLQQHPEMYNTATNNCTTNIASHVNELFPERIPWDSSFLLPKSADEYALSIGLLDTNLPIEEAREMYHINERVQIFATSSFFSEAIRMPLDPITFHRQTEEEYTLFCSGLSRYPWYDTLQRQIITGWTLENTCYNPELQQVVYMKQMIDVANYTYTPEKSVYGYTQIGVYNIYTNTFIKAPKRALGFYEKCSLNNAWSKSDDIYFGCGGGDAGYGYRNFYTYNLKTKTTKIIRECDTDPTKQPEEICVDL